MALTTRTQVVSNVTMSASFTTDIAWENYNNGSIHVVWANCNGNTAYIKLQGYNTGGSGQLLGSSQAADLRTNVSTFTAVGSTGSYMFNMRNVGFDYVRLYIAAGNATQGSMSVYVTRKTE